MASAHGRFVSTGGRHARSRRAALLRRPAAARQRSGLLVLAAVAALCWLAASSAFAQSGTRDGFVVERVAHAGGGLDGRMYTNSYQALDANLALGFVYFEIDFVFTADSELVCLHDWEDNFERTFGFRVESPLSLEEFEALAAGNESFTNCTLDGLAAWLRDNPRARIVTDVRGDLRDALDLIAARIEGHEHRVIPQIYLPQQAAIVRELGFRSMIWTLYRYDGEPLDVFRIATGWPIPVAVAMPRGWVDTGLPMLLRNAGIPSYVHTVNARSEFNQLRSRGVSEIYTAFLPPAPGPERAVDSPPNSPTNP
jgi:glycerophosphoryl diester phosphodiesterase